jgi:hypothetical protein
LTPHRQGQSEKSPERIAKRKNTSAESKILKVSRATKAQSDIHSNITAFGSGGRIDLHVFPTGVMNVIANVYHSEAL